MRVIETNTAGLSPRVQANKNKSHVGRTLMVFFIVAFSVYLAGTEAPSLTESEDSPQAKAGEEE